MKKIVGYTLTSGNVSPDGHTYANNMNYNVLWKVTMKYRSNDRGCFFDEIYYTPIKGHFNPAEIRKLQNNGFYGKPFIERDIENPEVLKELVPWIEF